MSLVKTANNSLIFDPPVSEGVLFSHTVPAELLILLLEIEVYIPMILKFLQEVLLFYSNLN
jgi:hypothetical protein